MDIYKELKNKAEKARHKRQWNDTLKYYSKIFDNPKANNWDKYFYALSLYKNNFFDKSLLICRKLYKKNKIFKPNNNLYARNINKKILVKPDYSKPKQILKAIGATKKLISDNDPFLSFEMIAYKAFKRFETDNKFEFLIWILDNFKPNQKDFDILKNYYKKKDNKYPPFAEFYYVFLIKSNFKLKNYQNVIQQTNIFIDKFSNFFYSHNIWMKRLKALSLWKLKKYNQALKIFFEIKKFKKDWFILFEIAQILNDTNNFQPAYYFAAKALLDKQNPVYKLNLYKFFTKKNTPALNQIDAKTIYCKIIDENNYKKNDFYLKIVDEINTNYKNVKQIDKKIKNNIRDFLFGKKIYATVIKTFSHSVGLVKTQQNEILFFKKDKNVKKIEQNQKVECTYAWNFDFKKKKVRKSCIIQKIL